MQLRRRRRQLIDGVDRRINEEQWSLAIWAQDSIKEGRLKKIVDTDIRESVSPKCLKVFAKLAKGCLHKHPKQRPTMAEVVVCLESILALQEKTIMQYLAKFAPGGSSVYFLELFFDNVGGENQKLRRFDIITLIVATENFSEANKISHARKPLYKGKLQNGLSIAVAPTSLVTQSEEEYMKEASILVKLEHENVVKLLGYCIEGKRWFLVYEFTMLKSLVHLMFYPKCTLLNWDTRYKIVLGVAKALLYLHKDAPVRVIHCDVQPVNILLDESLNAKLSSFWNARCLSINKTDCHMSRINGTFGYMAPEYRIHGYLSTKADVYSFGVLILEIITGPVDRSIDEEQWALAIWAQDSIKEGRLKQIVDTNIRGLVSPKCVKMFAQLAKRCLHKQLKQRPTMAEVVVCLESILALQEKANNTSQLTIVQKFGRFAPMFIYPSNVENSGGSSVKSLELYFDTVGGENQTLHRFDIDTLIVATQNFSEDNRIAPYSCGRYKGKLQNGQSIAVAPTSSGTTCEVYMNEASILAKLEHENVAKLLGYCIEGKIWFLVYEFTVLESLDRLMFGSRSIHLNWDKRYKIILGVARALLYLHKDAPFRVIHSDVNPRNIFLDESLNAKLSNFWNARCLAINETDRHVSRIFAGCGGYLAPEYVLYGDLSTKADVFNLGVLILQIIIGHKGTTIDISPEEGLLKFVEGNWLNGTLSNIIDPMIDVDLNSLTSFVRLLCVQEDAADRPTMEEVVSMLIDRLSLALPVAKMRQMITTTRECSNGISFPVDDNDSHDGYYTCADEDDFLSELIP
ncbi:hypothetical protein E3N88_40962 [Mikania micrantha]|uniref:Protein kinase domain-containing protein n=1 Tax=Mikania micrantha TaxID=192012 RepID=A0A5N6LP75_9ASTR|nr:hypothetical protein E3N88_40962 [Mikania micrantha]